MKTVVYPAHEHACAIMHPIDGHLAPEGAQWTDDGFTARMISDGLVTTHKAKLVKAEYPQHPRYPAQSQAPAVPSEADKPKT